VILHELFHYGQAKAAAALGTRSGLVDAIETVEYALLIRR